MSTDGLRLNRTSVLEVPGGKTSPALIGLRVFNITMIVLALCVLTVTGLYCISVCYSRTRQSKRAHFYESAVAGGEPGDPVTVKAVRRSTSFVNPLAFFRRPDAARDKSRIYYIYANPLPVGLREEEEKRRGSRTRPGATEGNTGPERAADPASDLILDPPMFYLQL